MTNETLTEDIVRNHFQSDPLFDVINFEEKKTKNKKVKELLKLASKEKKRGSGNPSFILTFPLLELDQLIIVECRPDSNSPKTEMLNDPQEHVMNSVLHYSKFLKENYDVIGIAVSGEPKSDLMVSTFKWLKSAPSPKKLRKDKLLPVTDYLGLFENEAFSEDLKSTLLFERVLRLNDEFHSYSIGADERSTIISAILLSLSDDSFKSSYPTFATTTALVDALLDAVSRVLHSQPIENRESILNAYRKILHEPLFRSDKISTGKEEKETIQIIKEDIIGYLDRPVYPLIRTEEERDDVLGKFYMEFIRHAGYGGKRNHVLTPAHVADLMCDLVYVTGSSIVYDPCCGDGGFLIAAMKKMSALNGDRSVKKSDIKSRQLVGVERSGDLLTWACTNMLLFRADGSAIYKGDCFELEEAILKDHSPTVALLNPPSDVGSTGQLALIEHALTVVGKSNGLVAAIVEIGCTINYRQELLEIKDRLLSKHRLLAVISMPNDLFHPAAIVPCIMIWQANQPNATHETWFGYLKDDGHAKRRNRGRIDPEKRWPEIKKQFVDAYKRSSEIAGTSVKKNVDAHDEWLAEAYMETDYTNLSESDFLDVLKKYAAFKKSNP